MASTTSSTDALRCIGREFEAARIAAMGDHQPRAGQVLQHFGQKLLRTFGRSASSERLVRVPGGSPARCIITRTA